jgi:hypothetical protein
MEHMRSHGCNEGKIMEDHDVETIKSSSLKREIYSLSRLLEAMFCKFETLINSTNTLETRRCSYSRSTK